MRDKNVILSGCFESEDFHPKNLFINEYISKIRNNIESQILNKCPDIRDWVGISIRRGDYLNNIGFVVPNKQWYLNMYYKYFEGRKALVFSDDIEWCMNAFSGEPNFLYAQNIWNENNTIILNSLGNLYLLSSCRDHICSCSTYSWWGCKLFEKDGAINVFHTPRLNNGKLEANNYIPSRWIKEPCNA